MRWIPPHKTAWMVFAWLTAASGGWAADPGQSLPPQADRLAGARARPFVPERAVPPILVPPPSIDAIPPATIEELRPRPPRVKVVSVESVAPAEPRPRVPRALPPSAPTEGPAKISEKAAVSPDRLVPPPPEMPELPETSGPAERPAPVSPWADFPPVQVFPRLGLFLVPGTGPGHYSFIDLLHENYREKPPAYPYPPFALQPPSGFDADYRYLDKSDNTQLDPFDAVKRMHPTPDTMVTLGGQHSIRFMNEEDSRLTRSDNSHTLFRNRVWADVWHGGNVRFYGEFISGLISGNELSPLPIDENRADILNLFAEVNLTSVVGQPVHVRIGRQEMLFGSQRLVTTLDWATTRRTFEGIRAFHRTEAVDVDAFWVRPVLIEPGNLDSANEDVQFYGVWATFRPDKGQFVDLYYLGLTDDTVIGDRFRRDRRGTQEIHTFGARAAGNEGQALFDFEGMVQTGSYVRRDHCAYAYTAALGWVFEEHRWRPQVWAAYNYASGTSDPGSGDHRTFNQLFAFGHYYLGYLDLVGRQNMEDISVQVAAFPEPWVTVVMQYHHFRLAEARDFLYSAAGRPTRRSPGGTAGRDIGEELDILANFHLTPHQDLLIGFSKLFAGDFIRATGPGVSPELYYLMYNFRW